MDIEYDKGMDKRRLRGNKRTAAQKERDRHVQGRPPLPAGERLTALVKVLMTPRQKRELVADARKAGLATSAYLVRLWLEKGGRA